MPESTGFSADLIAESVVNSPPYSDEIEILASSIATVDKADVSASHICDIRNGETALALQRLLPVDLRRKAGIFFTGPQLADRVAARLAPMLQSGAKLVDPACGAGNLLVACANQIPLGRDLEETLALWGNLIQGYDLHHQFVRIARIRLTLLAASLHGKEAKALAPSQFADVFKGVRVGDLFGATSLTGEANCVAVNPPFGYVRAPDDCHWSTGRVQTAGVFIERILRSAPPGQQIVAILPDVLRSGTRYGKWRDFVSSQAASLDIEIGGRFDARTDVDVFILHVAAGAHGNQSSEWPTLQHTSTDSVGVVSDCFDIHVGPVVPHRHRCEGLSYPYVHARTAPAWQIVSHIEEERRFSGRVFSPPFVVVHRTSSPSDGVRCVGTTIDEKRDVAVENHLLVLLPRDESLASCVELLDILKSANSNDWLNQRIRCRHLTVSALGDLPCPMRNKPK